MKRSVDISVISDVYLGTCGCHASELLNYLKSIRPKILIINGDFIDGWQFRKKYFPVPVNDRLRNKVFNPSDVLRIWF
jgi:UDP-2,3-diacylglucosamine pyrophosphatase LpxH